MGMIDYYRQVGKIDSERRIKARRLDGDTLFELYVLEERSVHEIAEQAGVVAETVKEWLLDEEIELRREKKRRFRHIDDVDPQDLAEDLDARVLTMTQIARKYDVSMDALYRFRKKHGFVFDEGIRTTK